MGYRNIKKQKNLFLFFKLRILIFQCPGTTHITNFTRMPHCACVLPGGGRVCLQVCWEVRRPGTKPSIIAQFSESVENLKMMDDDNIGKEGPEHFTEHGDEEGEDSDSGGSNVEEEHVRPYEHDPSFWTFPYLYLWHTMWFHANKALFVFEL